MHPRSAAIALVLLLGTAACADGMTFTGTETFPVVRVTEHQNKGTVTLRRGQQLEVVLHSTYWQFQKVSNPAVVRLERTPKVRPTPGCVAGGGCGTVTATYFARAAGSAVVTAARNSCGEAVGCTAATGQFTVRVIVRR